MKNGAGFKTSLGDMPFTQGEKYYFEISIKKGNLVKIGVSRRISNLNGAFCDTKDGWAIYNGETRHNSNALG